MNEWSSLGVRIRSICLNLAVRLLGHGGCRDRRRKGGVGSAHGGSGELRFRRQPGSLPNSSPAVAREAFTFFCMHLQVSEARRFAPGAGLCRQRRSRGAGACNRASAEMTPGASYASETVMRRRRVRCLQTMAYDRIRRSFAVRRSSGTERLDSEPAVLRDPWALADVPPIIACEPAMGAVDTGSDALGGGARPSKAACRTVSPGGGIRGASYDRAIS